MLDRRRFMVAAAATASTVPAMAQAAGGADASTAAAPASVPGQTGWHDGLAHPIPFTPRLGEGKQRGLVLGGGGAYLASWMVGYFNALKAHGIDVARADIVVGTSAGSFVGAVLTGGHLWSFHGKLAALGDFPRLFAHLIPTTAPNVGQLRARHLANSASEVTPAVIQAIGRAAMAARNPAGPADYPTTVKRLIGEVAWPSAKLHTTAVDCYTGERLIVSQASGIPVNHACAASSSLPGSMGPTWLGNRLCMDGGICQTSTHADVVAGVKKAIIVSLTDGGPEALKQGLRASGLPNTLQQEVKDLQAQGTGVKLVVAGLVPGVSAIDSIMNPKWIAPCLHYGYQRGLADVAEMKDFWGTA